MINKSVLIVGFGLAIAKSRQDESIPSNPNILQCLIDLKHEIWGRTFTDFIDLSQNLAAAVDDDYYDDDVEGMGDEGINETVDLGVYYVVRTPNRLDIICSNQ